MTPEGRGAGGGAGAGAGAGRRRLAWALEAIGEASERFAGVVERWGSDGLDAVVPTTPEWTLRDLAHHLGEVQRSWAENVRAGDPDRSLAGAGRDALGRGRSSGWLRDSTLLSGRGAGGGPARGAVLDLVGRAGDGGGGGPAPGAGGGGAHAGTPRR